MSEAADLATGSSYRWGLPQTLRRIYDHIGYSESHPVKGDFTTSKRTLLISLLAIGIGLISGFVAYVLLRSIGLITNVLFFQRVQSNIPSLADNSVGLWVLVIPAAGGLIVGLMARYGSERIRGHGIPEAIEAILMNGSKVPPRVAVLKPVSSAIVIGSGGPFGAEGPIIMTGGAIGSVVAQFIHLSSAERKTLLVAGAAGGMSATFAAPVSSVLLAVELLLFEWKPRSLIPVALASASAALLRHSLLGAGPLFPVPVHASYVGAIGLLACIFVGLLAGALSVTVTEGLYAFEDMFERLPIHWMWWPAIGGVGVGIGGLIFPDALGVGYSTIGQLLAGNASMHIVIGVLLVKSLIWTIALSSGTSGGVLAPLLMMGGALGALASGILPDEGGGFWAMMGMAAVLSGTIGSPLTALVFALELTHDVNVLLPLLVVVMVAHGFTVLTLKRSILTEKISRRGLHLGREYAVDPLEIMLVKEVMRTNVAALPADATMAEVAVSVNTDHQRSGQRLYPVLTADGRLGGVISRTDLRVALEHAQNGSATKRLAEFANSAPVVAYLDEPLRVVALRMADKGVTRLPVVSEDDPTQLLGLVALTDLLTARAHTLDEERHRERVLRTHLLFPGRRKVVSRTDP